MSEGAGASGTGAAGAAGFALTFAGWGGTSAAGVAASALATGAGALKKLWHPAKTKQTPTTPTDTRITGSFAFVPHKTARFPKKASASKAHLPPNKAAKAR
jgi:hypothetical protein